MINEEVMRVDNLQGEAEEFKTRESMDTCQSRLSVLADGGTVSDLEEEFDHLVVYKAHPCNARLLHYSVWVSVEAREDDAAAVRTVLDAKADPRGTATYKSADHVVGFEALHLAVGMGWVPCAQALVERGSSVELVNERTWKMKGGMRSEFDAPIHDAVFLRRTECVAWLLDQQADPNALNANGVAPLGLVFCNSDAAAKEKMTLLLLKHKARVDVRHQGKLPLEIAACDDHRFPRRLMHLLAPSHDGTSLFSEQVDSLLGMSPHDT
mmetsp:Transcript_23275/g.72493  ORF Transcript_23275/g.72493 Transcript_23275/m.72493 type:complete len:267 (-) Transcript_23275:85-885(-)